jgi:hypothetical protein
MLKRVTYFSTLFSIYAEALERSEDINQIAAVTDFVKTRISIYCFKFWRVLRTLSLVYAVALPAFPLQTQRKSWDLL